MLAGSRPMRHCFYYHIYSVRRNVDCYFSLHCWRHRSTSPPPSLPGLELVVRLLRHRPIDSDSYACVNLEAGWLHNFTYCWLICYSGVHVHRILFQLWIRRGLYGSEIQYFYVSNPSSREKVPCANGLEMGPSSSLSMLRVSQSLTSLFEHVDSSYSG